jgi:hypothetical protein
LTTTATTSSGIGTYAINGTGPASANYVVVYLPGTMTVTRAALTITADDKIKVSGDPLPPFTASYSGFKLGEGPGVVTGLALGTDATATSPAGAYTITASGASAANYAITLINGRLVVSPGAPPQQTIVVAQQVQTPSVAFTANTVTTPGVTTNLSLGGGAAPVAAAPAAGGAPAATGASAAGGTPAAGGGTVATAGVTIPGAPVVAALVTTSDAGVTSFANGFLTGAIPLPPPPAPVTLEQ